MCVSFGLDPRFFSEAKRRAAERALDRLADEWAEYLSEEHVGDVWPSRPTTKQTYPIITPEGIVPGWWGHLADGKLAPYFSINSRSERFLKKAPTSRALVPANFFFERDDGDKGWWRYERGGDLLYMAATIKPGVLASGESFTCYSVLTQEPPDQLAVIHDRTVMLVPPEQTFAWLHGTAPTVVAEVIESAAELQASIEPVRLPGKPA